MYFLDAHEMNTMTMHSQNRSSLERMSVKNILIRNTRQILDNPSPDNPRVVFFPTNQGALSSNNVCQDDKSSKAQSGFNTFAFLSFALTIFNAMR